MKCYGCGLENWETFGDINPERELLCCKECGALAFRVDPSKEEEIKDYYRKHYRPAPNIGNLITTAHKRAYIGAFLDDYLKDKTPAKTGRPLVCGDVGCATGYIPHWLRSIGHKATGCELTITYRRFAEHFYSVPVTEELDPKHKYDLITIYHVLEHLIDPAGKLASYVGMLADDGHMLISVPEWLKVLEEASGSPITDFQSLFHKDHINVFTETSLKNLFAHVGLEIVKEDHVTYGQTYLLKKTTPITVTKVEEYKKVMDHVRLQKLAIEAFQKNELDRALKLYPAFPDAWIRKIHGEQLKDREKQFDTFVEAFKAIPDNLRLKLSYASWLYMGEDLQKAIMAFGEISQFRPNEDIFIFMGWAHAKLGRRQDAMMYFAKAAEMNPIKWAEAMNAIAKCAVEIPCWEERAIEAAKEELLKRSGIKPNLNDPVMADAKTQ